jgi:hypothetical protein
MLTLDELVAGLPRMDIESEDACLRMLRALDAGREALLVARAR